MKRNRLFSFGVIGIATVCFAGAFVAMQLMPIASAQQPETAQLSLEKSQIYTLSELTQLIRAKTKIESYVDRRYGDHQVFVSKGDYQAAALLNAVGAASGLALRHVGAVWHLAPSDPTLGGTLLFPVMPKPLLQRLGKVLRPIAERADLKKEGVPLHFR